MLQLHEIPNIRPGEQFSLWRGCSTYEKNIPFHSFLTSTASVPTSTPNPVPKARPNTSPAPSVSSDPGIKATVVNTYTRAKATAPSPGLSSTHSRKDVRMSETNPSPGTWGHGRVKYREVKSGRGR